MPNQTGSKVRLPLYRTGTAAYANAATDLAEEPGGEGTVINVPAFDLALFDAAALPAGRYTIGLACTRGTGPDAPVERYWTAELELGAPDESGGRSWAAAAKPDPAATGAGRPATEATVAQPAPSEPPGSSTSDVVPAAQGGSAQRGSGTARSATGGPPSFHGPAAEIVDLLGVSGSTWRSVLGWSLAAAVCARAARLLTRPVAEHSTIPRTLES